MRIPLLAALVAAALALPAATASPVDLYLNSSGDECVFRTDSNGLAPKIGSGAPAGALSATGQFIDQCAGGSQTPPSDAQIEILVPSSYAEDSSTPLALTWRASADHCQLELPANWSGSPSQLCNSAQSCFIGGTADLTTTAGEGNYQVGLTCSRTGGAAITKTETVQVTVEEEEEPPPTGCPAQPRSRYSQGYINWSGFGHLTNHPLDQFHQVFGRRLSPSTTLPWPEINGNLIQFKIPKDNFIALRFTVPSSGAKPAGHAELVPGHTYPQVQSGMISFSKCPGDFGQAGSTLAQKCLYSGHLGTGDLYWQTTGVPEYQCHLEPGATYYMNIASNCTNATCQFSIGNWFNNTQSAGSILGIDVLDQIGWPDD